MLRFVEERLQGVAEGVDTRHVSAPISCTRARAAREKTPGFLGRSVRRRCQPLFWLNRRAVW